MIQLVSGQLMLASALGQVEFDWQASYLPAEADGSVGPNFSIISIKVAGSSGPELLPAFDAIDGTEVFESLAWEDFQKGLV